MRRPFFCIEVFQIIKVLIVVEARLKLQVFISWPCVHVGWSMCYFIIPVGEGNYLVVLLKPFVPQALDAFVKVHDEGLARMFYRPRSLALLLHLSLAIVSLFLLSLLY